MVDQVLVLRGSNKGRVSCVDNDRVHTGLEKSLNLTFVMENSWNFIKMPFFLEFQKTYP